MTLFAQACPSFVEFVERGDTTSPALLRRRAPGTSRRSRRSGVDTLILGCTHYPLLRGAIHHVMGDGVLLLSSAEETADDVYESSRAWACSRRRDRARAPVRVLG